ncbi:MAG: GAF domain-containing protein [Chloroflexota bacterium]
MTEQAKPSIGNKKPNPLARAWDWATAPHPSLQEVGEIHLARLASSFSLAILLSLIIGTLSSTTARGLPRTLSSVGLALFATLASYALSRTRFYQLGVFIFSISLGVNAYLTISTEGAAADPGLTILLFVPLSLIVASIFLNSWAVFLLTGLNMGAFYWVVRFYGLPAPRGFAAIEAVMMIIGVVLIFLNNFRTSVEKARLEELTTTNRQLEALGNELEQRVEERTFDLEQRGLELQMRSDELVAANLNVERNARKFASVSDIARQISSIRDLKTLLPNVAEQISRQFGFYHVGIFLMDATQSFAVLSATNSQGGKKMLERGHRLKVGEEGIVGFVTKTGSPRIVLDTGADTVHFDNPDLPETRSEMAVPLRVEARIIGALDIQDKRPNAFDEDDIEVIATLADLVSIAIENARSFEDAQKLLTEAQSVARQYSQQEWQGLRKKQNLAGVHYKITGTDILDAPIQSPVIEKALEQGDVYIENEAGLSGALAMPIKLRDQIIGVLNISSPGKTNWSEDEIDIARAVAERVAISAENARLFEETTRRAERERAVSSITSKIRTTNDPQSMLQIALDELQKALGGAQVQLRPLEKSGIKPKKPGIPEADPTVRS